MLVALGMKKTLGATEIDALWSLVLVAAVPIAVFAYERVRFAELRERLRHAAADPGGPAAVER